MDAAYRRLLTYSYNILGSVEDAKDVVQDVMERFLHVDKRIVKNEVHYLTRMVINHSINFRKKAEKQAAYGVWLPEPVATETAETILIREQVAQYTLLVLMEVLGPKERAVYVLREAFNYSHEETAKVLGITPESARQLYVRSKKSLNQSVPAAQYSHKHKLSQYIDAIVNADVQALEELFAEDIRIMVDGGDKIRVVRGTEDGRIASAQFVSGIYSLFLEGKQYTVTQINHQPAICFWKDDRLYNCQVFSFDDSGQVKFIYSVVDPKKLESVKPG